MADTTQNTQITQTIEKTDTKPSTKSPLTPKRTKLIQKEKLVDRLFGRLIGEGKELQKYWKIAKETDELEVETQKLTDAELKDKTKEFRARLKGITDLKQIEKKLKELMPEAFAVVREAAFRTIKQRHYPVQIIGASVLHEGRIAEMRTGEGKTLVATLAVYLNALPEHRQVHVVTVNDYLARRDASWMGQIYNFLGLTIGVIQNQASFYFQLGASSSEIDEKKRKADLVETFEDGEQEDARAVLDVENLVKCERKRAYWVEETNLPVDVVYGVNSEFGFDYLRDNMASTPDEIVQKAGHCTAIIDEVDSILIDEARTPLIISNQAEDASEQYRFFANLAKKLRRDVDYEVDEKRKNITLTDLGVDKVEKELGIKNMYESEQGVVQVHMLDQALKALALFNKDKEYVVRDGEIIIVDENTGRLMYGRRYNLGLHQSIEAKEKIAVKPESRTVASITFQNYFRLYDKLAGMTGTASTESEEFFKIYKLLVVSIPTNKPNIRKDEVDKIFKNEIGKFKAIVKDIKELQQKGQPVLVGTTSIEKNLLLSQMLTKAGVKHELLNAKNHESEARIISGAGVKGAVTIATNIAGRGVDIKLGGEIPKDESKYEEWKKAHQEVVALGGLFVIGTERHESRRIDNQLRGRSGRQGDPGRSQFYISLEDYILRVFGGDRISYFNILPIPDDEPIQNGLLGRLIEEAQKKIEGFNYDTRKYVTDFDDVINRQRSVIYKKRKKILMNEDFDWKMDIKKTLYREILVQIKSLPKPKNKKIDPQALKLVSNALKDILNLPDFDSDVLEVMYADYKFNPEKLAIALAEKISYQLDSRWEIYEEKAQNAMVRFTFLRAIDILWTENLVTIDNLQDSVRLTYLSQKDPLVEFKEEGMRIFVNMFEEIDREIAKTIFKVTPDLVPAGLLK
jgi:preprotein translocase subunit SecA